MKTKKRKKEKKKEKKMERRTSETPRRTSCGTRRHESFKAFGLPTSFFFIYEEGLLVVFEPKKTVCLV